MAHRHYTSSHQQPGCLWPAVAWWQLRLRICPKVLCPDAAFFQCDVLAAVFVVAQNTFGGGNKPLLGLFLLNVVLNLFPAVGGA